MWAILLSPLCLLYRFITWIRRHAYRLGILQQVRFEVPIVVIGNITAGGTGKTPLVITLVEALQAAGWRPGVVSRGYGGKSPVYPLVVDTGTPVEECGDEPALIAKRAGCPVVVDPIRARAVRTLLSTSGVDAVVCDDGLQHYALARDIEWVVVDGVRRMGNGWLLPSGPLREGIWRLKTVDATIVNGGKEDEAAMHLRAESVINLKTGVQGKLQDFSGHKVHALAGIGNPQRFFEQLRHLGIDLIEHPYPDHHAFLPEDISFEDDLPVLMTEKDAVKCANFAGEKHWAVPVHAELNSRARIAMEKLLEELNTYGVNHG